MKKIQPTRSYVGDRGYPSDTEAESGASGPVSRRRALRRLLVGASAVGGALLLTGEARARSKLPLPGGPPLPTPPRPRPRPQVQPCATELTLPHRFTFCNGTSGQVHLTCSDGRLLATLRQPSEALTLRRTVFRVLRSQRQCAWLKDPQQVAAVERALAAALHHHYQQQLGRSLPPLTAELTVVPPPAPTRRRIRLLGVPARPLRGGCASCATADEPGDLLAPVVLTAAGLAIARARRRRDGEPKPPADPRDHDA